LSLDNALWFAYIAIEAAVVGLLFSRRIWRTLPIFCLYCIWDVLSNVGALLITHLYPAAYFKAYFAQTIIDSILQFGVLVELAWSLLRPLRASLPRKTLIILGALILLAGAAVWPFAPVQGFTHVTRQVHLLMQLQQTTSILRILFFLFLAAGSNFLSISWRDRELQVASGLGFASLIGVTTVMLQAHETTASQFRHLNQISVAGYLCCVSYWAYCFLQKEAERREFTPKMQSFLLTVAGAAHSSRVALSESRAENARKTGKL
jgi:hypothetical protein